MHYKKVDGLHGHCARILDGGRVEILKVKALMKGLHLPSEELSWRVGESVHEAFSRMVREALTQHGVSVDRALLKELLELTHETYVLARFSMKGH